jgi:hypothetical protein
MGIHLNTRLSSSRFSLRAMNLDRVGLAGAQLVEQATVGGGRR